MPTTHKRSSIAFTYQSCLLVFTFIQLQIVIPFKTSRLRYIKLNKSRVYEGENELFLIGFDIAFVCINFIPHAVRRPAVSFNYAQRCFFQQRVYKTRFILFCHLPHTFFRNWYSPTGRWVSLLRVLFWFI